MLDYQSQPDFHTAFFPFCGLGAGALGFLNAQVELFGRPSRFVSLGGVDIDKEACKDFEMITNSPAMNADMFELTPTDLRVFVGPQAPDVVFSSPPCVGFSGLLSKATSQLEKYQKLNQLVFRWADLMINTWVDSPPKLLIMENVPRITSRGAELLAKLRVVLINAGYRLEEGYHDCGELGGLAQHRRRYLLVARLPHRCPEFLYRPPIKRVRGCGEVLEKLPIPGTVEAKRYGRIHQLPKISWLNWIRLALIPAGGDWRDLPGVLEEGQKRREVHKRYAVSEWDQPTGTVCGDSGSNAASFVADPRPAREWRGGVLGVRGWNEPSVTITGRACPSTGAFSVADPRLKKPAFDHAYRILRWDEPSFTVAGQSNPGCGAYSVADPRVEGFNFEEMLSLWNGDPKKAPPFTPVIIGPDGCWHRPMTTLELAMLQGLPQTTQLEGGSVGRWRSRIGNAVPVQAAQAIAMKMLVTLSSGNVLELFPEDKGPIWVVPLEDRNETKLQRDAVQGR